MKEELGGPSHYMLKCFHYLAGSINFLIIKLNKANSYVHDYIFLLNHLLIESSYHLPIVEWVSSQFHSCFL